MSLLENDIYKFSMSYAYMTLYPEAEGTFVFQDRDETKFDSRFIEMLSIELCKLSQKTISNDEMEWLRGGTIKYIPLHYWEWLNGFRFDYSKIYFGIDDDGKLHIEVTDKLYKVTLYEVPILAIVSEVRNKWLGVKINTQHVIDKLNSKINFANEHRLYFSEFGLRRRYSKCLHEEIVKTLKEKCPIYCLGTSNVYLAYKYGMKPMGTMAHEWVMFHGANYGYRRANQQAIEQWQRVFHGSLGIALIDTYTTKSFLKTFTCELSKLFDGLRQDSGDEIEVGNMIIDRYRELGINPMSKTIVFSNALTFEKYERLARYFRGQINVSAGIGTNITNDIDIDGYKPANIVMKLMKCRMTPREEWLDCIKISDDKGKHIGNCEEIDICKKQLKID